MRRKKSRQCLLMLLTNAIADLMGETYSASEIYSIIQHLLSPCIIKGWLRAGSSQS